MNGLTILYEDEEIFVINKNSGLAVQGGANVKHSIDVDFSDETNEIDPIQTDSEFLFNNDDAIVFDIKNNNNNN